MTKTKDSNAVLFIIDDHSSAMSNWNSALTRLTRQDKLGSGMDFLHFHHKGAHVSRCITTTVATLVPVD